MPLMSSVVKTKKKAKRRLLNLYSVLTVTKKNDRNNEMNIVITATMSNKLILSINYFLLCFLEKFIFISFQVSVYVAAKSNKTGLCLRNKVDFFGLIFKF